MIRGVRYAVCGLLLAAGTASADERTIADGVYTEAQAASGEEVYRVECLTCHDERYFRPVLRRWEGQSLEMFYTIMSTSMPQSNPGALPLSDYTDILAYILSLSRYPAGDEELHEETLDEILVAPRK